MIIFVNKDIKVSFFLFDFFEDRNIGEENIKNVFIY